MRNLYVELCVLRIGSVSDELFDCFFEFVFVVFLYLMKIGIELANLKVLLSEGNVAFGER